MNLVAVCPYNHAENQGSRTESGYGQRDEGWLESRKHIMRCNQEFHLLVGYCSVAVKYRTLFANKTVL